MIRIPKRLIEAMGGHGRRSYQEECCGVLFGREENAAREVEAVEPLPNSRDGQRHRRFLITSADYRRAELEAARRGSALLGFYHSHPDHPARPSAYDLEHAWPFFSYVIVSVMGGNPAELRSFVMREDRSAFEEEEVEAV